MKRQWISLGGWCGPSLILAKLGRTDSNTQMPFDMVRCTLDGIAEFTKHGFGENGRNFFPEPSPESGVIVPDPVSIWLLFRGLHTAFTHYDLNRPQVRDIFLQRMERWSHLFKQNQQQQQQQQPVITFLRTSISEDPLAEMRYLPKLMQSFDEASGGKLDYRFVLVHHDQRPLSSAAQAQPAAKPLCFIDDGVNNNKKRAVMWSLRHDPAVDKDASLFDKSEAGYSHIVRRSETEWQRLERSLPSSNYLAAELKSFEKSRLLSHVEGVSAFRGSCTGFGSTLQGRDRVCAKCGDITGHALESREKFDTGRNEWTEEEEEVLAAVLVQHIQMGDAADVVASVESAANALKRGANETLLKLNEMGLPNAFV